MVIDYDENMGDMSGGNFSLNKKMISQQYFDFNNGDVCKGYGLKKDTLSPNVKVQIIFRILMMIMKRVMVMWLVDMVFKTATVSTKVMIKVTLMTLKGVSTRAMLVVDIVLWTDVLIYNIMVWNNWWMIMIGLMHIWMIFYRNDYVISGTGLLNSHTLLQDK